MRAPRRTPRNRRRAFNEAARRGTLAVWLALVATNVFAQISGTASLVSNYRFRGVSLSGNEPAAQLGLAYDDAQGWYTGVFASTVKFATPSRVELQAVPFVGYAWRSAAEVTWEVGADYSFFSGSAQGYAYPEFYVGVASGNLSGRLYYSPRYFGLKSRLIYAELNATPLLFDRARLLAHLGLLTSINGDLYYAGPTHVLDARIGVGVDFDQLSVQLSWVGTNSAGSSYGITGVRSRNGPVLTLTRAF